MINADSVVVDDDDDDDMVSVDDDNDDDVKHLSRVRHRQWYTESWQWGRGSSESKNVNN